MSIHLNGQQITPTTFPDGTSQVWKLADVYGVARVTWLFEHEAEFLHLAQLIELLPRSPRLWLPYLPYGRQDKPVSNGSTFALKAFGRLVNSLGFDAIETFDPHSDRAARWIASLEPVSALPLIERIANEEGFEFICTPDEGAWRRYSLPDFPAICGEKVRDQSTGRITHYNVSAGPSAKAGARVLVVDDICDGGATFVLLGERLKSMGLRASLYVSHGIFSKGLDELRKYYDRIYTTDSRPTRHKELIVYESAPPHRLLQS